MPFRATAAIALAATLASACSMMGETPAATAPAAKHAYAGVYGGSYVCTDGEHGFYLDIATVPPRTAAGSTHPACLDCFQHSRALPAPSEVLLAASTSPARSVRTEPSR